MELKCSRRKLALALCLPCDTKDYKSRAADITKDVAGVRQMDNNITVKEERKP